MSRREKRIAQVQNFLGRKIIKSLIHPEREGIQGLDKQDKDQAGIKSETHPNQDIAFLLNSFEQNCVQQLVLIQGPA
jgi:hypothetical protein